MRKHLKKATAAFAVTAAASVAGLAFAAWTSTATGSGTAQAGTSLDGQITAVAHAPDLFPGAEKTVTVEITNPNDYPVVITEIGASSSVPAGQCAGGTVTSQVAASATGLAQTGGQVTIAPQATGVYQLTTAMRADATDACKSATFSLPLTAQVRSNA